MAGVSRTDVERGEMVTGLVWLGLGAVFSLLLEVVYLGARIPLGDGRSVACPVTILIAAAFNVVLTKTARLWSHNPLIAGIPAMVWTLGFFVLLFIGGLGSVVALGNNILTILLLFAGVAGAFWPLFTTK